MNRLRCPLCGGPLELFSFIETKASVSADYESLARDRGLAESDFARYIENGLLACHACQVWFPILQGVPVLLSYTTSAHREFSKRFGDAMGELSVQYSYPAMKPAPGERFVLTSFSNEWQDYDYDGVIWEMTYDDHEKRFLAEMAFPSLAEPPAAFLEVGCGLGISTAFGYVKYRTDCVGVDLSQAAFRAAKQYKDNPFLHFIQASTFHLPFAERSFDLIYSRGVLHHTYSTRCAFSEVSKYCKPGGGIYLWVYGPGSKNETLLRRIAFALEAITRPVISYSPDSLHARVFLSGMALGYTTYNAWRRLGNPTIQKLNFRRAVHAARDRFTPRYAHRHDPAEVVSWFKQAGFDAIEIVDWRCMPAADWDDYRRNVGVRGVRANGATSHERQP